MIVILDRDFYRLLLRLWLFRFWEAVQTVRLDDSRIVLIALVNVNVSGDSVDSALTRTLPHTVGINISRLRDVVCYPLIICSEAADIEPIFES